MFVTFVDYSYGGGFDKLYKYFDWCRLIKNTQIMKKKKRRSLAISYTSGVAIHREPQKLTLTFVGIWQWRVWRCASTIIHSAIVFGSITC